MVVGVKGMKMPTCCAECRMKKRCEQGIAGGWREDKRVDDCPLVEIVTCKDCRHKRGDVCRNYRHIISDDFYCKDAERRD